MSARRDAWVRTRLESTSWSGPQQSYGKVVTGVAALRGGRALLAQHQEEVLSARAPGVLQVLRATHTSHACFSTLQLVVNPLDTAMQRERREVARSGALGGRRPPSRVRSVAAGAPPAPFAPDPAGEPLVSRLRRQFAGPQEQLQSPAIVAARGSDAAVPERDDLKSCYKVNFPDEDSEDGFYDSCPEKESVFKDESEQLEEWRRASKMRRSLQIPRRYPASGSRPADLPDNWGSVSRIRRELENSQKLGSYSKISTAESSQTLQGLFPSPVVQRDSAHCKESSNRTFTEATAADNFTIKPSTLKNKTFISTETLNEVRGRLKSLTEQSNAHVDRESLDWDDGIDAEHRAVKDKKDLANAPSRVRSYVYGMEAMCGVADEGKPHIPCGTNSLESRVSKLSNLSVVRGDDWYTRRKSYGFEKVHNNLRSDKNSLSSHDNDNIESSTDSGICRSSEVVNSLTSCNAASKTLSVVSKDATADSLITFDKQETFEDWLVLNKKQLPASGSHQRLSNNSLEKMEVITKKNPCDVTYIGSPCSEQTPGNNSIIEDNPNAFSNTKKSIFHRRPEGTTVIVESNKKDLNDTQQYKRHSIAIDGIKGRKESYEQNNSMDVNASLFSVLNINNAAEEHSEDVMGKKGKKVEFCKTEVHFAAESGRVNIVETDGKPPSTNNFRRRRRQGGIIPTKEIDLVKLSTTHFGDSVDANQRLGKELHRDEKEEAIKLNYAVITEIKSVSKEMPKQCIAIDSMILSNSVNADDVLENDLPRGILKNKLLKPKPYHLGENGEIPDTVNSETNVWGVKLKPIQNSNDTPLWRSSITLTNNKFEKNHSGLQGLSNDKCLEKPHSTVAEVDQQQSKNLINDTNISNNDSSFKCNAATIENKGYSTKINFGRGEPIIETSFHQEQAHLLRHLKDCTVKAKPTVVDSSGCSSSRLHENQSDKNTTKISIDIPTLNRDINIKSKHIGLFNELKSAALVNIISNSFKFNQTILIERNVKSLESKRDKLKRLYEGKQMCEDCADDSLSFIPNSSWHSGSWVQRDRNAVDSNPLRTENTLDSVSAGDSRTIEQLADSPVSKRSQHVSQNMNDNSINLKHSFSETLTTPRSLMPGRGSARKLREHELCYFGIKTPQKEESAYQNNTFLTEKLNVSQNSTGNMDNLKMVDEKPLSIKKSKDIGQPIYENMIIKDKPGTADELVKPKHPGESIIEELTKAADEILLALNGYSDEGSLMNSSDDELTNYRSSKNKVRAAGLATISETNSWRQKSKALESKSIQTILPDKGRHNRSTTKQTSKNRTSSNSSIESIARDSRVSTSKQKKKITIDYSTPDKPTRRKMSSGDVTKARRLQRATSRDALLQIPGSSSEDLAIHVDYRKKSIKRLKNVDVKKSQFTYQNHSLDNTQLVLADTTKSSNRSIILPEIRHKTALSTIKSVKEKNIRKEKINEKTKLSTKERSRRREKLLEGTIASLARDKTIQSKSRSTETSLDRESGRCKDKHCTRDTVYRKEVSHKFKSRDDDHIKRVSHELAHEMDKKRKHPPISTVKSGVINNRGEWN